MAGCLVGSVGGVRVGLGVDGPMRGRPRSTVVVWRRPVLGLGVPDRGEQMIGHAKGHRRRPVDRDRRPNDTLDPAYRSANARAPTVTVLGRAGYGFVGPAH